MAAFISPTSTSLVSPSDDESSSIVTVQSTGSNDESRNVLQLHFSSDFDNNKISRGIILTTQPIQQQQQVADHTNEQMLQTIVEVINPMISGDGSPNRVAVGHSIEPTYSSLDENDNGNTADDEYDSINSYNPERTELSLNDKMRNVLQELVTNERVRLSFTQSLSDDDDEEDENVDDDDDSDNDTEDDENDSLQHDFVDGEATKISTKEIILPSPTTTITQSTTTTRIIDEEPNGNQIDTNIFVLENPQTSDNNKSIESDNLCFDSNESTLTSNATLNDTIYENPNFLATDTPTKTILTTSTTKRAQSEQDEKLKEKLLSELNIGERKNIFPTAVDLVEEIVDVAKKAVDVCATGDDGTIQREQDDDNEDDDTTETTNNSTTEATSKSSTMSKTSGGGAKRKRRKSKSKKK